MVDQGRGQEKYKIFRYLINRRILIRQNISSEEKEKGCIIKISSVQEQVARDIHQNRFKGVEVIIMSAHVGRLLLGVAGDIWVNPFLKVNSCAVVQLLIRRILK
ncbi:hypothetical protein SAMN02745220_03430 [Desulfopila aestuarii DSM 18488]|uniref:Uncharacterized protein n=1 Tax=Desulfopila aestuarii DSM 18488 TaxID=1121416 RepID=A0A1M7YCQ9_9BACT|nr:hypothetical protein SAMN02745220_03430 [Desulfopila aestuarii DSM 18488]